LGKTLKVPFESYSDLLPNNTAWATRIPYKNKREQIVTYTDCKAVENGWIWTIPLWSRIGTGYVYSDKFIDDDAALKQFQKHLGTEEADFKKIKMRIGLHERVWEKNVVAIGLSSGFIEPLESNGLYTVHEFLRQLIRDLKRDKISQWDRENFNHRCKKKFRGFAEFVALHYTLSHRDDTEYWKHIQNKNWLVEGNVDMFSLADARRLIHNFMEVGGIHAIAAGMHYSPTELSEIMWSSLKKSKMLAREWEPFIENLNKRKNNWEHAAKKAENTYDFLKRYIYEEKT
jgi:tryptophan halogenase